jgi:hypothetical protein
MEILAAYDLVGTYRGAAELAGCDHHTVKHHVERRAAGLPPEAGLERSSIVDPFRPKIEELVDRSHGRIRADVVHDKLVAMGFGGTDRTTRRAVEDAKKAFAAGRRRVYRPWITEPGAWLQFDWGWGPGRPGRPAHRRPTPRALACDRDRHRGALPPLGHHRPPPRPRHEGRQ